MDASIDDRTGVKNDEQTYKALTIETAYELLSQLDGERHTLLTIDNDRGQTLSIGGGPSRYVVTLDSAEENLTLVNDADEEQDSFEICAGGQFSDFPASICVKQPSAKLAVDAFFRDEVQTLDWS